MSDLMKDGIETAVICFLVANMILGTAFAWLWVGKWMEFFQ